MKYKCTIEIELPINKVIRLWTDENHFVNWQDGFQSIKHYEGEPNTVGAKSKIIIHQGKIVNELIETILTNNLPQEKKALYEHVHMVNSQTTRFERVSDQKTTYISEVDYLKFNGLMPKVMATFFPGMFKKQSKKWMNNFKEFAENYDKGL